MFYVDSDSKSVIDYSQYRLYLKEANASKNAPTWHIAYKASELFNVTDLTEIKKLQEHVLSIDKNPEIYKKTIVNFFSDGPQSLTLFHNTSINDINFRNG